jgi:hypothetical protein
VYIEFFSFLFIRIEILVRVNVFLFPFFLLSVIDNILLFSLFTKILYQKSFYLKEFFYFSKIKFYLIFSEIQ